jgi:riboflavin kinase/FMN adenylyltransferase
MKKVVSLLNYVQKKPTIVTIGTFDGVHIGHQKIIKRLVSVGKKKHLKSVVLTFFPHPRMVLHNKSDIKLLNTIEERGTVLQTLGLDQMVVKTFTKEFSNLTAEAFVKSVLVDTLNAKYIIIGYDHQFGKDRSANISDLKVFGKKYDFEVEEISAQDVKDVSVSSTKIRTALINGDITTANTYLGYPYFLTGTVVKGKGLGKALGFPTANINVKEDYKLIPQNGVYVVRAKVLDKTLFGMMNIGTNPTVDGETQSIEAHFFDFNEDVYNQVVKIEFLERLRDEQKFESLEFLQEQLKKDKVNAQLFLQHYG